MVVMFCFEEKFAAHNGVSSFCRSCENLETRTQILRGSEVRGAAANYHAGTVTYACRSVAYVNHLAQNCHSAVTYVL